MSVTKAHRTFARAVVALARQHGMNSLTVTFNAASSSNFLADNDRGSTYSHEQVTLRWSEGRHGDTGNIVLESAASETIPEHESKGHP